MNNITERIEIINSYNLLNGGTNKRKINSVLFYIYMLLVIVLLGIVLWSILTELTGLNSKITWNRTSMSVLFSISISMNALKGIYSGILLKHLNFLKESIPRNFDENLNIELAKIIAINNKPLGSNAFIVSLAIIILIGTVINFFMDNQFVYYKFFIAPTLLFYILAITDCVKTYKKLKANIADVENCLQLPFHTT